MSRLAPLVLLRPPRWIGVAHKRRVSHSFATHRTVRNESLTKLPPRSHGSLLKRLWSAYCVALEQRPLFTKASMACVIFWTSDSVTQYLLHSPNDTDFQWNAARAASAGGFGVASTTFLHVWWGFLERTVAARLPLATHRVTNTAVKVLLHQSMGAPFYIYSYYIVTNFGQRLCQMGASTTWTERGGRDAIPQAWKEVQDKAALMFWPTMMRHWSVWPWVQSFNFYFTPLHHRVLVHNTVLTLWSGYLSYLNHNSLAQETKECAAIDHPGSSKNTTRVPPLTSAPCEASCTDCVVTDSSAPLKSR